MHRLPKAKKLLTAAAIVLSLAGAVETAFAQMLPDDPAVRKAKEETVVVFDLGRVLGFLYDMDREEQKLSLSTGQAKDLYALMSRIKGMERIEPDEADDMLVRIEDEILTPDQLMYVDQRIIAREQTRESSTDRKAEKAGGGGGGGGQVLSSYVAGGAFNPMTDAARTIGKDFAAFYQYLEKKTR